MNNLEKQLKNIGKKISEEVNGEATFSVLFNSEFMKVNTEFESIDELFEYSNVDISTQEDYNNLPQGVLDEVVNEKTEFNNWEEMQKSATKEEMKRRLNKIGIKTE